MKTWCRTAAGIAAAAVLAGGSGCAALQARSTQGYRRHPDIYPATRMNFGEPRWPVQTGAAEVLGDGMDRSCSCLIWPLDFPVSVVTDTLLLPLDILRQREACWDERYVWNALYGPGTPSADGFRRHYRPEYSRDIIVRYLRLPRKEITQEKLDMMLEADVDPAILANSSRLTVGFADDLLAGSADAPYASRRGTLLSLASNSNAPPEVLRRMAAAADEEIGQRLVENARTPPDVMALLVKRPLLAERAAENRRATPDTLLLVAEAGHPRLMHRVLDHPNATANVLQAVVNACGQALTNDALCANDRYQLEWTLTNAVQRLQHPAGR